MHGQVVGRRIAVIPHEWYGRLSMVLCYFLRGPLVGLRQQIEPEVQPNWLALPMLLVLVSAFIAAPPILKLALVWTCVSPAVLYTFSTVPETVYEHRGYLSLLGIATLAAWCAERAPQLIGVLVALYFIRTVLRNGQLRTAFGFWRLAYEESPNHWRVRFNYAQQLQIQRRELDALPILQTLLDAPRPCGEVAAQHMAAIYLKHERWMEAESLLGPRGIAILKFPNSPALRTLRGNLLNAQGKTKEAELSFRVARALA